MSEPVGIIYPPPDLRGIVDSTAKYAAKNGPAFEERIKREHRDKPKFSFLFSGDPFNAYYRHKVGEIRAQLLSENELKATQNAVAAQSQEAEVGQKSQTEVSEQTQECPEDSRPALSANAPSPEQQPNGAHESHSQPAPPRAQHEEPVDADQADQPRGPKVRFKLNEYIQEMTMKFEKPPPLEYLAAPAASLTCLDWDVIKLTAQFVAVHGRDFLMELISREQNNSLFDFLKPQHGQYSYMSSLITQYSLIHNQTDDILEQLSKDATSQKYVLDKIKMRAEWNKMLELEQRKLEEAEEKEKLLYSQIDWHDFVIVETIDYQPDEKGEYPPTTADQVGTRLLIQQRFEEQNIPEQMDVDMEVESDDEQDSGADQVHDDTFAIPEMVSSRTDKVPIRKDYDPKAANRVTSQPDNYFVSPITNERIPVDKIHEHVRFNLSDPKHLEKKDQMLQERMNDQIVFASGSQIQNSLKSLAERRTDIFGINDEEAAIGKRIGDNAETQTKEDKIIWDGHKSSLKKKKLG